MSQNQINEPVDLVILQEGEQIFSSAKNLDDAPEPNDENLIFFGKVEPNGTSNPTLEIKNVGYETAYEIEIVLEAKGSRVPQVMGYPKQLEPGEIKPLLLTWKPDVFGTPWVWGFLNVKYGYIVKPKS